MNSEILNDITSYISFLRDNGYLVSVSCFDNVLERHLPTLLEYEVHLCAVCSYLKANDKTCGLCAENKRKLNNKHITKPYYSCCYAGVEEFVIPIFSENSMICCINVSGYKGKLKKSKLFFEKYKALLGEDYVRLYNDLKSNVPKAQKVLQVVKPLEYMFKALLKECLKQQSSSDTKTQIYTMVLRYIYDNYMNDFTLESMAKRLNYSPSYLRHTFYDSCGKSISKVLNNVRLSQAQVLLKTTSLSITNIAVECGFCDGNYFSTVFKKEFGITPKQYRNQIN